MNNLSLWKYHFVNDSHKHNYEFQGVHMTRIRDIRSIWNSVDITGGYPPRIFK